jgi:hypothetical protein
MPAEARVPASAPLGGLKLWDRLAFWARGLVALLLIVVGAAVLIRSAASGPAAARGSDPVALSGAMLELQGVMRRLENVELENVRLKQMGALLLILMGVAVFGSRMPPFDTIEANKLILRDGRGRLRVGLTPDAGLVLLDHKQRPRVELSAIHDSAALKLFDPTRQRRVELTEVSDGAVLAISDCSEHPRVALLGVSQDGPSLSLVDGNGAVTMAVSSDGPNLVLLDSKHGRGTLEVTQDGPHLILADAQTNPYVVIPEPKCPGSFSGTPPGVRAIGAVAISPAADAAVSDRAPVVGGPLFGNRSAA